MQGAEKIFATQHMFDITVINFFCNTAVGMKSGFLEVP